MLLSKALNQPEFKTRDIVLIGTYRTEDGDFAVLAHSGEKLFPIPRLFHLVELRADPKNPESDPRDPDVSPEEIRSILARFDSFGGIFKLTSE